MIKKNIYLWVGSILGCIAGYLYWHYVGCESGSCPLTSSPVTSILYGAFMGGLIGDLFRKKNKN